VGIAAVLGGQTSHAATFGSSMEEAMSGPASGGFNMARTIAANTLLAVSMVIAWFTLFRSQRELAWAYARNLQERLESMKNTAGKSILQKLQEAKTNVRYNGGQLLNTMMAKLPGKGGVEGDRNAAERGISESYTESGA
jgi:hypothetical protein